ncbi:MAG TPA: DUF2505 domain-containing protein [Nocardioidaceae bacterium]|nr:DUF2505 domain-containing protein [Nocardioidaceae bacterium]
MRFLHTTSYDAPPAEVQAMLTDPVFREKVCVAVKSVDYSVDVAGSTITVNQTQRVRKVPAFAAKLVGETIQIHQVEQWSTGDAKLELNIPGKPGHLVATIVLSPAGEGTTYTVDGELKASITLIGGKLEGLIEKLLKMFLTREGETGQKWLAGER